MRQLQSASFGFKVPVTLVGSYLGIANLIWCEAVAICTGSQTTRPIERCKAGISTLTISFAATHRPAGGNDLHIADARILGTDISAYLHFERCAGEILTG